MANVTYRGVSYDTVEYANQPTTDVEVQLNYRGISHEKTVSVPAGINHLEILREKLLTEQRLHDARLLLAKRG